MAVGDWVVASVDRHGDCWVLSRVPPQTHIARRDADGRRHAVVSNVDTALLVMGLDDDFNPRRIERYLVLVQASGVQPVVVLTKADVVAKMPGRLDERLAALQGRLPAQIDRIAVDATAPSAALALAPYLAAGQTLVMLGSSGAGKSTLTNTLLGAATQDTGAVRESDGRGMHTTTARSLHRLAGGACVIDTPGVRTLRPDTDAATLAASFDDIEALSRQLPVPRLPASRRARLRGARGHRSGPPAQLPEAAARVAPRHDRRARAPAPGRGLEGARTRDAGLDEDQARRGVSR